MGNIRMAKVELCQVMTLATTNINDQWPIRLGVSDQCLSGVHLNPWGKVILGVTLHSIIELSRSNRIGTKRLEQVLLLTLHELPVTVIGVSGVLVASLLKIERQCPEHGSVNKVIE